jgi:hypothetical protein
MTVPQSRKSARRARWLSIGHGGARLDIRHPQQIVRQVIEFNAIRRAFVSRSIAEQLAAPAGLKSARLPAALKSP